MGRCMEQPRAPTLGGCAITRVLFDIRHHASMEDHLPIARGITAAIEVAIRTFQYETRLFPTSFNAFRPSGSHTISVALTRATGGLDHGVGHPAAAGRGQRTLAPEDSGVRGLRRHVEWPKGAGAVIEARKSAMNHVKPQLPPNH
jgi:hypothetical protein